MAFNQTLVDNANHMLAPLNGTERFLTIATGHFTGLCRATNHGCKTPEPQLRDSTGCINKEMLCKDAKFKSVCDSGWTFTIYPWQLEAAFPELPLLGQQALNAEHGCGSAPTEMETAATIGQWASMQRAAGNLVDWQSAQDQAASSEPACKAYIHSIMAFVKKYGGGAGAPLIKFLDDFAKEYNVSLMLGAEFFKAVTELNLPSNESMFAHVITAVMSTQLSSPKVVDGLARLLTKTDVAQLRHPAMQAQVKVCAAMLADAWLLAHKHAEAGEISQRGKILCVVGRP